MMLPEYDSADATELAGWVARGEVSPLELVEAAVERIDARNPALNAVVHQDIERAKCACASLPDGPLRGVPFLLKDLHAEDTGQPSTGSCRALSGWHADHDATLVRRYKRAGLNILGRTNTPEFGIYGVTESIFRGPCRNPYNPERTPGGSSGGAAAAVAARMVPVAHAGDGGGSIRIPASHCGLFGLKPTRARTPIGPDAGEGWSGLVTQHVVSQTVRDSALFLDVTCGPAPGDPYHVRAPARPYVDEVGRDPGKLVIRFTNQTLFGGPTDPENATAVRQAAAQLEKLGHHVEEGRPPFDPQRLTLAYLGLVAAGVAASIAHAEALLGRSLRHTDVEPATWMMSQIAHKQSAAELGGHRTQMFQAGRRLGEWFQTVDIFLTPTTAIPAVPIGTFRQTRAELLQIAAIRTLNLRALYDLALHTMATDALNATPNTMLFNLTGQPAASMPLHHTATGLPVGVQAVARFGEEATLIRLASQLEQQNQWSKRSPLPSVC